MVLVSEILVTIGDEEYDDAGSLEAEVRKFYRNFNKILLLMKYYDFL